MSTIAIVAEALREPSFCAWVRRTMGLETNEAWKSLEFRRRIIDAADLWAIAKSKGRASGNQSKGRQ